MIRIGTAGWTIPRPVRDAFPAEGSGLQRYAAVFGAVEINSTFYRPHKPATFARWVETTPETFRFAVKLPKVISHERRLVDAEAPLDQFLAETAVLGDKRGPILIQLPPSLVFDAEVAGRFLTLFRDRYDGNAALEARNASWFTPEADALLIVHRIARVAADPALSDVAARPGGWTGLAYWRLHGSPRMYATPYGEDRLRALASNLTDPAWVMFDNTMSGAAAADALMLKGMLDQR